MNKALVINNVESIGPSTCCNLLKKVDGFEKKVSEKLAIERKLTEKFNSFNGATFKGEKVNTHDLYVENLYSEEDTHGVFRFKQENKSNNYQLYFGPLIKVERKNLGCNTSFVNPHFLVVNPHFLVVNRLVVNQKVVIKNKN